MNKKLDETHLQAWRLFITAHAQLIGAIDNGLSAANRVPLHWYDVLIELYEAPNQQLRMHELAERVVLSRSGLTRLVDRLEKEQLLRREVDREDRRGFYVVLTEAGTSALRKAWPSYAEGISEYFAQHLNEEEANTIVQVFSRILEHVKKPE